MEASLGAEPILHYLPATVFLVCILGIFMRTRAIATQLKQANGTSLNSFQMLDQTQQSLENRKS
jgi:hypothetical protein